jgi:hypothetical protein
MGHDEAPGELLERHVGGSVSRLVDRHAAARSQLTSRLFRGGAGGVLSRRGRDAGVSTDAETLARDEVRERRPSC